MKRVLFKSCNLIGDCLNISPALRAWHAKHPETDIDLLTLRDHVAGLYKRMGVPLNLIYDTPAVEEYDFFFDFDVNAAFSLGELKKIHVTQAYAELLNVDIAGMGLTYEPEEEEHEKGLILVSASSRSCASWEGKAPNKMLPWPVWAHILVLLRQYGPVGILGGPQDRLPLPVAEREYYLGQPLNRVALMLRDAKMLVTIDNGLAHLAASQKTKAVEFYPACLGKHWIIPMGNPDLLVYQMDPMRLQMEEAILVVRQGLKTFIND